MNNNNENTHLLDPQEQYMENNDIDQYEIHDKKNDDLIPGKELEHIHPGLENHFPYPTMISSIMTIHHNDPEHIINNPEGFCQHRS